MINNIRNFHAHGGNEWVIGGKLTFLPGAVVEGGEGLFDNPASTPAAISYIADSEATSAATLKADFNALLEALRTAGLMQDSTTESTADENDPAPDNTNENDPAPDNPEG